MAFVGIEEMGEDDGSTEIAGSDRIQPALPSEIGEDCVGKEAAIAGSEFVMAAIDGGESGIGGVPLFDAGIDFTKDINQHDGLAVQNFFRQCHGAVSQG
jgi:hypothetical protein